MQDDRDVWITITILCKECKAGTRVIRSTGLSAADDYVIRSLRFICKIVIG